MKNFILIIVPLFLLVGCHRWSRHSVRVETQVPAPVYKTHTSDYYSPHWRDRPYCDNPRRQMYRPKQYPAYRYEMPKAVRPLQKKKRTPKPVPKPRPKRKNGPSLGEV